MKEYRVYISELHYGSVVVEAENEEQAVGLGYKELEEGNIKWHDMEVTDVHADLESD